MNLYINHNCFRLIFALMVCFLYPCTSRIYACMSYIKALEGNALSFSTKIGKLQKLEHYVNITPLSTHLLAFNQRNYLVLIDRERRLNTPFAIETFSPIKSDNITQILQRKFGYYFTNTFKKNNFDNSLFSYYNVINTKYNFTQYDYLILNTPQDFKFNNLTLRGERMYSTKAYKNDDESTYVSYKKFTRRVEDFICGICGACVAGNGYTNHCSNCLYSKHVDVNPGDRASPCKGMMRPIKQGYQKKKGVFIVHQCEKCGHQKKNKISKDDNKSVIDKLPW